MTSEALSASWSHRSKCLQCNTNRHAFTTYKAFRVTKSEQGFECGNTYDIQPSELETTFHNFHGDQNL